MRRECWFEAEAAFDHILRVKSRLWRDQVPSLIYSFIEYLPSTHCVLDTVVDNYRVNKTDKIPTLRKLKISWGMREQKVNK